MHTFRRKRDNSLKCIDMSYFSDVEHCVQQDDAQKSGLIVNIPIFQNRKNCKFFLTQQIWTDLTIAPSIIKVVKIIFKYLFSLHTSAKILGQNTKLTTASWQPCIPDRISPHNFLTSTQRRDSLIWLSFVYPGHACLVAVTNDSSLIFHNSCRLKIPLKIFF